MTDLSPQAQAVMDAYNEVYESDRHAVAAALRAAADQTRPHIPSDLATAPEHVRHWWLLGNRSAARTIKAKLLAIAAELEGNGNG